MRPPLTAATNLVPSADDATHDQFVSGALVNVQFWARAPVVVAMRLRKAATTDGVRVALGEARFARDLRARLKGETRRRIMPFGNPTLAQRCSRGGPTEIGRVSAVSSGLIGSVLTPIPTLKRWAILVTSLRDKAPMNSRKALTLRMRMTTPIKLKPARAKFPTRFQPTVYNRSNLLSIRFLSNTHHSLRCHPRVAIGHAFPRLSCQRTASRMSSVALFRLSFSLMRAQ